MKGHRWIVGPVFVGLLAVGAWLASRWYTTPTLPAIPLDGLGEELREPLRSAIEGVRQRPRSAEAWGELGLYLGANQINDSALVCLGHAERLDPNEVTWPYWRALLLTTSNHGEAIHVFRRALTLTQVPENQASILIRLALALIEDDQLEEAADRLRALGALEPDSHGLHFALGVLASRNGARQEAREHLRALVGNPHFRKRAYSLLATLTEGEEANAYLHKAARLPEDIPWLTSLERPLQQYKISKQDRLTQFYKLGREGKHAEAVHYLVDLASTSPDENVCFALGYTLLSMQQVDEGERQLRLALTFDPSHIKANLYLGIALYEQGKKRSQEPNGDDQALEMFREAVIAVEKTLKSRSEHAQAHLYRGLALKHLRQTDESLQSLRRAVLLEENSAENHLALGEALAEAGLLPEALESLHNAVRHADPQDSRPREALKKWRTKAKAS